MKTMLLLFLLLVTYSAQAQTIALRLTGNPIPQSFIQEKVEQTLKSLYGEDIEVPPLPMTSLLPNHKKKLMVSFVLPNGEKHVVDVTLTSEFSPKPPDAFLLFSDHPEMLHGNGVLFSAGVIFLRPIRLNYYHENGRGELPRAVSIRLLNRNDDPALVHIQDALVGPGKDEMGLGHNASLLFLKRKRDRLGYITTVPPHGTITLSKQVAKAGELVTGLIEVTELSGHPLEIGVFAEDLNHPWEERSPLMESKDTHARGAYEMSNLDFRAHYTVSNAPTIVPLGDLPLQNLTPGIPLKGSYGMVWSGTIEVQNPFLNPETVPLYFQPRGGGATATIVLDGVFHQVKFTPPYESVLLTQVVLAPRSRKRITFETVPEGGSSYPINLVLGRMQNP